ncbi:porin [Bradyrhizobium elkanii]|uniref:porin n=1 Tax=Bradyrhizobium elkanii TaxID=29448 RepID=UPI001BAC6FB9|nr:porin [Bradyrhizobium elkanii]MBR1165206.1 porin [Bradyrhizobium elkanii]
MKLTRAIILSSAAILASFDAQAADFPVKAKSVDYVKVCSLYGPGFYYIPGTDTCLKLGGYLRAHVTFNSNSDAVAADNGVAAARNRLSNAWISRSREALTIDTRTATEYGVLRTYFMGWYTWTSGGYSGAGNGSTVYQSLGGVSAPQNANPGAIAGGALGVPYAFIQFAGFTIGKATSQFSTPWGEYPANNTELPGSSAWDPVNQFSYTADFGQGVALSLSAQDQVVHDTTNIWNVSAATAAGLAAGSYGGSDIGGTRSPDLIASLRVDQAWGLFQASVAAHENHAAYYGADETSGHPDDKWGWAGQLALSIKNLPTGAGDTVNLTGVYASGASRYTFNDYMSTTYARYSSTSLAGAYQSVGLAGLSDSVFVAGSGQQLTTTYGFNAGYTHNWNPYWFTQVFGGWGAVRYNNTAKGYICSAFVTGLTLSSGVAGCNPDFNYATFGTYTAWSPVKNFVFGIELSYNIIEQKYASGSTVTLPAQASIAKPAGVYELRDQGTVTALFRAQRNW